LKELIEDANKENLWR